MSRYRRFRNGQVYFFTVVTHERRPILCTEDGRRLLREAIQHVQSGRDFTITGMVLLPDHLHTIWELPAGDFDYSTRWRYIKSEFTKTWIAAGGDVGSRSESRRKRNEQGVWQRRFYEHACRDDDDLKRCLDYLHVNPVKHGLTPRVRDWPWSSFHRYVKNGEYDLNWGGADVFYGDEFVHME